MTASYIDIVPFSPAHAEGVLALILPIQQIEFGVPVTIDAQPDLLDIEGFYQQSRGNFWVAVTPQGEVVGSIALLDIGDGQAALRKMFVAEAYRGRTHGVGLRLLDALLQWAQDRGIGNIFLGTTELFLAAHRFYEKNGFEPIAKDALPARFPVMAVDTRFYARRAGEDGRSSKQQRIFVYGTLKEGFPNFAINPGKRIPGTFRTVQRFPLYLVGDRHSPWLVLAEGQGTQVEGQVFEVDEKTLQAMDRLERIDMPDGYRRLTIHVVAMNDPERIAIPVHAYLKPADMLPGNGVMLGPLPAYEQSHAELYAPRSASATGLA